MVPVVWRIAVGKQPKDPAWLCGGREERHTGEEGCRVGSTILDDGHYLFCNGQQMGPDRTCWEPWTEIEKTDLKSPSSSSSSGRASREKDGESCRTGDNSRLETEVLVPKDTSYLQGAGIQAHLIWMGLLCI